MKRHPPLFSLMFLFVMSLSGVVWAQSVPTPAAEGAAGNAIDADLATGSPEPDQTSDLSAEEPGNTEPEPSAANDPKPDHVRRIAPWPEDKTMKATLHTDQGDITCELFAGAHPLTVLNFKALAEGKPAWTDASGKAHETPYYQALPFGTRVKNRYVTISDRSEGTGFVVVDERCRSHQPVAGSIVMVQKYPGQASAQFMLLASDIPEFKGMYAIFGQCAPLDTIEKLTETAAILQSVSVVP